MVGGAHSNKHGFQECLPRAFELPRRGVGPYSWQGWLGGLEEAHLPAWSKGSVGTERPLQRLEARVCFDKEGGVKGRRTHHPFGACSFILCYWPVSPWHLASPSSLQTAWTVSLAWSVLSSLYLARSAHPSDVTCSSMFLGKPSLIPWSSLKPAV